ncbi:MAG: hypothetical protein IVW51_11040 [Thermaceae bacterium]|nr:hypothetical protein [Thermaceae bacterium]
MQAVMVAIQCEWVPGTMDQVKVRLPRGEKRVSVNQLQQVAGVDAVNELYLRGLISLPITSRIEEAFSKISLER